SFRPFNAHTLVAARQIDARPEVLADRRVERALVNVFKTVLPRPPLTALAGISAETVEALRILVPRNALVGVQHAVDCGISLAVVGVFGAVESERSEDAVAVVRAPGVDASGIVDTELLSFRSRLRALVNVSITACSRPAWTTLA
ncbi:hypothetical protein PMAYCL1PPCAC_16995, partial [Pristionchus mayeri]